MSGMFYAMAVQVEISTFQEVNDYLMVGCVTLTNIN